MRVFLAGATGVIGSRVVPELFRAGHQVTAMTRRREAARALHALGADPVLGDVTNAAAVSDAVARAKPDVVMNQLSDLRLGTSATNAALRIIGGRNLAEAAARYGVRRMISQSIAWAYRPGDEPATEDEPLDLDAAAPRQTTVRGVAALESATAGTSEWVVLRYGMLYGPGTWFALDGARADDARAGRLPAHPDVTSFLHVDDAAAAAVQALDWPSGPVNICDEEPAGGFDWVPAFCRAVGARPPEASDQSNAWARGADSTHARSALGWVPRWPTWRDGFAAMSFNPPLAADR